MEKTDSGIFQGCIPALMTPCDADGAPRFDHLVTSASDLVAAGMRGVVYCGSMGDWPLLTDDQRMAGVEALCAGGIPVVVGTGAQSPRQAVAIARHARDSGASGLMVIPRVLSRGISPAAQEDHFSAILQEAANIPAVIYNSPYYGFETKADLFFRLRKNHPNLVGFKEFGGAGSLTYAAENITSGDPNLTLMVGVDTQVCHGYLRCGAQGAITGVGNALPEQVLRLIELCELANNGDAQARQYAFELEEALMVLSKFDEGPDLVLYYKELMVLTGHQEYQFHINPSDNLSPSQKHFLRSQYHQFIRWWNNWQGK